MKYTPTICLNPIIDSRIEPKIICDIKFDTMCANPICKNMGVKSLHISPFLILLGSLSKFLYNLSSGPKNAIVLSPLYSNREPSMPTTKKATSTMHMREMKDLQERFGQNINLSICKKVSFRGSGLLEVSTNQERRKFGTSPWRP